MSFDRRPPPQAPRSAAPLPETRQTRSARPTPSKALAGLLALAILVLGTIVVMLNSPDSQIHAKMEYRLQQSLNPEPPFALLRTARASGWDFGTCTLMQPPRLADKMMPDSREDDAFQFGAIRGIGASDEPQILAAQANFLDCVARSEASSLCEPEVRNAFIADVTALSRDIDFVERYQVKSELSGGGDPAFAKVLQTLNDAAPELISGSLAANEESYRESRAMLLGAVQSATAQRALRLSDIGFFGRDDLKDVIAATTVSGDLCSGGGAR